jgi:hypothetical protein
MQDLTPKGLLKAGYKFFQLFSESFGQAVAEQSEVMFNIRFT